MLKIDYVEFSSSEFEQTEHFFKNAFGWSYIEYGSDYRDIQGAGIDGGLERSETRAPIIVLKSDDLEADRHQIVNSGVKLEKDIYSFPRRAAL